MFLNSSLKGLGWDMYKKSEQSGRSMTPFLSDLHKINSSELAELKNYLSHSPPKPFHLCPLFSVQFRFVMSEYSFEIVNPATLLLTWSMWVGGMRLSNFSQQVSVKPDSSSLLQKRGKKHFILLFQAANLTRYTWTSSIPMMSVSEGVAVLIHCSQTVKSLMEL